VSSAAKAPINWFALLAASAANRASFFSLYDLRIALFRSLFGGSFLKILLFLSSILLGRLSDNWACNEIDYDVYFAMTDSCN
jgi:hypothetical protein